MYNSRSNTRNVRESNDEITWKMKICLCVYLGEINDFFSPNTCVCIYSDRTIAAIIMDVK